jgi:pullulanase/glycogen debranching enzyme
MLLAGDEFLRTQQGNNNAWCQDNDISWLNWDLAKDNADFVRFVREMITLRKRHPVLRRRSYLVGRGKDGRQEPDIAAIPGAIRCAFASRARRPAGPGGASWTQPWRRRWTSLSMSKGRSSSPTRPTW